MTGRTQTGAGDLLELVRSGRAVTRGALQQATGLSRATVGQRLDRLFRAGWLREGAGGPVDSPLGGRPSITLEFDDAHAVVLAADLETRHARACVLSLTGEILAEHSGALAIEDGPDAVLGELGRWFAELLEKAGHRAEEVCGIGLAVPGPVDLESGRVVQPPIMPGWDGYDIRGRLRPEPSPSTPGPVRSPCSSTTTPTSWRTANSARPTPTARRSSWSRSRRASAPESWSTARSTGASTAARATSATSGSPRARRRCAAAVPTAVSPPSRAAVPWHGGWRRPGCRMASGSDVRDLLASGHPEAAALAREAGRQVGDVLATVVTLLNPGVLMIAGDLAGTPFLTGVRELLYQRALPRSTARLEVVTSRLGERAGLIGAGALVVEHLYAPARVEERLLAMGV